MEFFNLLKKNVKCFNILEKKIEMFKRKYLIFFIPEYKFV